MTRCTDPTCWRTPHDRSDHAEPARVMQRELDTVRDLLADELPTLTRCRLEGQETLLREIVRWLPTAGERAA